MIDHYPTPAYLMGAMLEDGVDIDRALKVALGYGDARNRLDHTQTYKWLMAMLQRLGLKHSSTALAVLTYPSDHDAPRYEQLARENGWKEGDYANTPEQK